MERLVSRAASPAPSDCFGPFASGQGYRHRIHRPFHPIRLPVNCRGGI